MTHIPLEVTVWGDFACFTRPELHVERVTYPVMTPTAARGVLEAIFWKPEFRWNVREIAVVKPIAYTGIMRNEVNHRQSERTALSWSLTGVGGYDASDSTHQKNRAQRNTLALKDVQYIIRASIDLRPGVDAPEAKYRDQFRRRVERGQCFAQPYLGCREFSAFFAPTTEADRPLDLSMDLGRMLLDLDYADDRSGSARPRFFHAQLDHGVMRIPRASGDSGEIGGRDAA